MGVGPLLGQLHFLPSVEAEKADVFKPRVYVYANCRTCDSNESYSPCVGAEAVKGQIGSKE